MQHLADRTTFVVQVVVMHRSWSVQAHSHVSSAAEAHINLRAKQHVLECVVCRSLAIEGSKIPLQWTSGPRHGYH